MGIHKSKRVPGKLVKHTSGVRLDKRKRILKEAEDRRVLKKKNRKEKLDRNDDTDARPGEEDEEGFYKVPAEVVYLLSRLLWS